MSRSYLSIVSHESPALAPRGAKVPSGNLLALRWLKTNLAEAKKVAARLGVSVRTVHKWANAETNIPTERIDSIIWVCKSLKVPLDQLDCETDLYLSEKHGQRVAA